MFGFSPLYTLRTYFYGIFLFILLVGNLVFTSCLQINAVLVPNLYAQIEKTDQTIYPYHPEQLEARQNIYDTFEIAPVQEKSEFVLPMIMFHYIEDTPKTTDDQMRYNLSFSPKKLEELLIFFQKNNIQTLTYWDIAEIFAGKKAVPERAVMLTFDDGHLDHYTQAFPLLEKYHAKGVFFIIGEFPTTRTKQYMNWNQIRTLRNAGHEIASHTMTHPDLTTLNEQQLHWEVVQSKKVTEEQIGEPIISFCYPLGRYTKKTLEFVSQYYLFARTTEVGKTVFLHNLFEMHTVPSRPDADIPTIIGQTFGIPNTVSGTDATKK